MILEPKTAVFQKGRRMKLPDFTILRFGVWSNASQRRSTPPRFLLTYELEFQHTACGTTNINGVPVPIRAGSILFGRPGDVRRTDFTHPENVNTDFIYFSVEREEPSMLRGVMDRIPACTEADDALSARWEALMRDLREGDDAIAELRSTCELAAFLTRLSRKEPAALPPAFPSLRQQAVSAAIGYMETHLSEHPSVGETAAHVGYSESHFSHMFKSCTGYTPHAYLRLLKMSRAKYLLLNTANGLDRIAASLSYAKTSDFCRDFKRFCGMTPRQFRKTRNGGYNS